MTREYPSTPDEAFLANVEGNYYSKHFSKARTEGRIGRVPYDENLPVFVAMDLGIGDATAIWWYQRLSSEIRLIDYYENSGEPLSHYVRIIKTKPYIFDRVFAPHDASSKELGSGLSRTEIASGLGIEFDVLPRLSNKKASMLAGIYSIAAGSMRSSARRASRHWITTARNGTRRSEHSAISHDTIIIQTAPMLSGMLR